MKNYTKKNIIKKTQKKLKKFNQEFLVNWEEK